MTRAIRIVVFAALCAGGVVGVLAAFGIGRSALGDLGGILAAIVAAMLVGAFVLIVGVVWFTRAPIPPAQQQSRAVRVASEPVERERA
jgi:hypothetical protein